MNKARQHFWNRKGKRKLTKLVQSSICEVRVKQMYSFLVLWGLTTLSKKLAHAQTWLTAMIGTAHRREHRWPFEENRDWWTQCGDRQNGEANEKIQNIFNRVPRYSTHILKNDTQSPITDKFHCQPRWEESGVEAGIIHASATPEMLL